MIDQKLIEEIVRRVLERLANDPRFQRLDQGAGGGSSPLPTSVPHHHGRVLSEWDVLKCHRAGGRALKLGSKVIVTPLARDRAKDLGVELLFD